VQGSGKAPDELKNVGGPPSVAVDSAAAELDDALRSVADRLEAGFCPL
jgi:hypothetical protein